MRKFLCFAFSAAALSFASRALASEAGMPQLNPEFWLSQIFWLIIIFSALYLTIWKVFLPRITYSIENRKSKIVNDLNEAQKLKENAEKKLKEYNLILENSKKDAKKIIEESKKKLDKDIKEKKIHFNNEIEKEIETVEKEIKEFKKSSLSNIKEIAAETSAEVIKQILDTEINKSNVVAIVNEVSKTKTEKYL